MKKYAVIAKKWDSDLHEQIEFIAGEFNVYFHAKLFLEAYNAHYKAGAIIAEINY